MKTLESTNRRWSLARVSRIVLVIAVSVAMFGIGGVRAETPAARFTYVTMADGVKIAVAVHYPDGYSQADPRANPNVPISADGGWPTLLLMDGYGASSVGYEAAGNFAALYRHRYVVVLASLRGTGCSGGAFEFLSRADAEDGRALIDEWMPEQPWFNGDVGIAGESYWAITGSLVASTRPRELDVIAIANTIDDLYRGVAFPGGVPNYDLPLVFLAGLQPGFQALFLALGSRFPQELSSFVADPANTDPTCARHIAMRQAQADRGDPYAHLLTSSHDDEWYRARSPITYAHLIDKPIHFSQHWQDEVTGPRGANTLWERISGTVPKRIVMSNGIHSEWTDYDDDLRWLDCWTYGDGDAESAWCDGDILEPSARVRVHFEQQGDEWKPTNAPYRSSGWPLPETVWSRYHLHDDGTLSTAQAGAGGRSYISTPADRHTTDGRNDGLGRITYAGSLPDELSYELAFDHPTALAGPINLTLHASSTQVDTDFFVDVLDVAPDGAVSYLQRGLQRASHRAIDDTRSDVVSGGPHAGAYYRAYLPHMNATTNLLTPGVAEKFEIEIFPLAHVFREGHRLVLKIHAPSAKDPVSPFYARAPGMPPAVNTIYHGAVPDPGPRNQPTSVLLPLMPVLPPLAVDAPACGALRGIPCFRPL